MRRLDEKKKIVFRYRGNGKFAVRKREKQQEAIERKEAYQKQISTVKGIEQYMDSRLSECGLHTSIGAKQYDKLMTLKDKLNKK